MPLPPSLMPPSFPRPPAPAPPRPPRAPRPPPGPPSVAAAMPRGQLEPPHALVQERNSFPDFRSSSLPPAAPARDTKSDALLNDIAAQLRECRRRSRPPRSENLELPKVIWEGSRFGGARALAQEIVGGKGTGAAAQDTDQAIPRRRGR